jgi:hypothetical protein
MPMLDAGCIFVPGAKIQPKNKALFYSKTIKISLFKRGEKGLKGLVI